MTWVRSDDQASIHRKVAPLDDATYRLWREAIDWCSRNLTDGRIAPDELDTISKRATRQRADKLVSRELWHTADHECPSEKCPKPGPDGWVIHDYLDYQFSKERVVADLAAKAERTRKWREAKKNGSKPRDGTGDASRDASSDGVSDASPSPTPSPPRRERGTGSPEETATRREAADGAAGGQAQSKPSSPRCSTCDNALTSPYHRNSCRGPA